MSKFVQLGDIAKVYSGGTPSRKNSAYWNGNIPWVKTAQIQNSVITSNDIDEWITEEALKCSSARMVPKGTILMAMYGQGKTRGQVAILGIDATINQACAAIQVENVINRDFVYQQLLFRYDYIRSLSNSGSQENLSAGLIREIQFLLPTKPEQTAIANLLCSWDAAIEKTERLIAAMERQFIWLSGKLLFGSTSPDADDSNRTRWFAVPAHWRIVKIGSVAKEVKTTNDDGDNIPVLSCSKHDGLVDSLSYFGKQVFSLDTSTYKVVTRGEFAYATNHIEEGSIGYQNLYDRGLVSPMYTVFRTNEKIEDGYLYKVLKTATYRHIFEVNTSASVDRRGSLRWNEFAKLPIPLPPIEEQRQIDETLNVARKEIDLLKKKTDAYRNQKRGLMQKLLIGAWRMKVGEEELA